MIEKSKLEQILGLKKSSLNISKPLIRALGLDSAIVYSYLLSKYFDNNGFSNDNYFICSVEELENELTYTPFKQRNILQDLEKKNLINIKFGQARTRYIGINEDLSILENILYKKSWSDVNYEMQNLLTRHKELLTYINKNTNKTDMEAFLDSYKETQERFGWLAKALIKSDGIEAQSFKCDQNRTLVFK